MIDGASPLVFGKGLSLVRLNPRHGLAPSAADYHAPRADAIRTWARTAWDAWIATACLTEPAS
jgi:hypothetical protein